jgi:hypothetical protein
MCRGGIRSRPTEPSIIVSQALAGGGLGPTKRQVWGGRRSAAGDMRGAWQRARCIIYSSGRGAR